MNEYEAATLAVRAAALWAAYGQIAATLMIGLGQIAVVWYGIRAMQRMGAVRAREQDQRHAETMQRLDAARDADHKRHAETMQRLDAARDADHKRHEEVMAKADQRHEETMAALNELIRAGQAQTAALETVIERTAPGARA